MTDLSTSLGSSTSSSSGSSSWGSRLRPFHFSPHSRCLSALLFLVSRGHSPSTCPPLTTPLAGSTATILAIDCFTATGLKEFYLINTLGYSLFPKLNGHYPITLPIQVELGIIAALTVCGVAVQMRFYETIVRKAKELRREDRERDEEEKVKSRGDVERLEREKREWEERHKGGVSTAGRRESYFAGSGRLSRMDTESSLRKSPTATDAFLPRIEDLGRRASR